MTYDDGTREIIQEGFTCTPTVLTKEAKEITVAYQGAQTIFSVNVTERQSGNDDNNNNNNKDNSNNNSAN